MTFLGISIRSNEQSRNAYISISCKLSGNVIACNAVEANISSGIFVRPSGSIACCSELHLEKQNMPISGKHPGLNTTDSSAEHSPNALSPILSRPAGRVISFKDVH